MSRGRRAALTREDRALWRAATRDATPLSTDLRGLSGEPAAPDSGAEPAPPARREAGPSSAPEPSAAPRPGSDRAPAGRRGASTAPGPARVTLDPAPPAASRLGAGAPGLDRRTAERLRRGAREPEARIDLHGLTAERAHRALERCIAQALARGLRLVLVITGKGARPGPAPDGGFMPRAEGLLRREAPRWLRSGPHAREIVGIYEANVRHGGTGAFYVYLKRRR